MNNLNQKLNKIELDKRRILANYQKDRHLELLKRSEELKLLSIEESQEALELSRYSALLQEQLNWETRDHFLRLQEKYLKNKITIGEFCQAFSKRDLLNSEAADMLESNFIFLSPHKKSLDFSMLIDPIFAAYYEYDPDELLFEIYEKEFRDLVETTYLQIQKLLKE